ncbi:MAG: AAA family ATPase [Candidatus Eremiobacteraeota bacterium]|nr:AAA family ATPase [Candidatus Eremiobacteraeota bacterium]MBC5801497.1 AAA family ATPase [Candidatus Eremiobacteraeota bacterium]MBC5822210.1 AAA family ATPase [Candidatus Eremiobacteraeota bacterium]
MIGSLRVAAPYIERRRLQDAFDRACARQVAIVCASSGAGKSTAIGSYMRRLGGRKVHYAAAADTRRLVAFVRGLAEEFRDSLPALTHGLGAAAANAAQTPRPATTLAHWFVDHLGECAVTLALDDLHLVDDSPEIIEFIVRAVERSGDGVRWILGLRSTVAFPIASWLAAEKADLHIDEESLAFTHEEASALAASMGCGHGDMAQALGTRAGHVGRQVLALAGTMPAHDDDEPDFERLLEPAAARFVQSLTIEQLTALHALLRLPSLDESLISRVPLGSEVAALLGEQAPFGLALTDKWHVTRAFTAIADEVSNASADLRAEATNLAIYALEDVGALTTALRVAAHACASSAVLDVLERHGFALADGGYGDLIDDALRIVSAPERNKSSVALALEAMRESDLGRHDVADAWFSHAAEIAPTPAARARVQYVYAGNLLRRGRLDCIEILEAIVDEPTTPELKASAIAALGAAYGSAGRWHDARRRIDEALLRVDDIVDIATRASVYQSAAYVALQDHDAQAAERYAGIALSLSDEHGYDRIVVLALILRFVVASSYRDDITTALDVLRSLEMYANRLGNAYFRRYALLGLLESHAERGDRSELERAERALASEEVENDVQHAEEALFPSRAMRLAWTGDFVGAYRLLASSAERHMDLEQRASRWSEIAVYAAAGDLDDTAIGAIVAARKALRGTTFSLSATLVRARLNLALAALLLGRLRSAALLLGATEQAAAGLPRLRKFHALLRAMLDRRRGCANHEEVLRLLETMTDEGFGGVAGIVEAIPDSRTTCGELAS